mgnify:CR=1 FL=1
MLSLYTYSLQMLCECISDLHNNKLHLYLTINGSPTPTSVTFNPDIVKNLKKPVRHYKDKITGKKKSPTKLKSNFKPEDYKKAVKAYFRDTSLLNARLSWANDSDTIEIGLWGKNLFDERYVLSIGGLTADVLGTPVGRINRGIETGIDFKYSF